MASLWTDAVLKVLFFAADLVKLHRTFSVVNMAFMTWLNWILKFTEILQSNLKNFVCFCYDPYNIDFQAVFFASGWAVAIQEVNKMTYNGRWKRYQKSSVTCITTPWSFKSRKKRGKDLLQKTRKSKLSGNITIILKASEHRDYSSYQKQNMQVKNTVNAI